MIRRTPLGGGGSGAATRPVVRQAWITDGSGATLPNTGGSWAAVPGFSLALPAAVGDYVEIGVHALRSATATAFLDIGVMVSGSIARFMATGTNAGATEGDPGWYLTGSLIGQSAPRGFIVTSGDLGGSAVTFAVVAKAVGSGTVFASTDYPFYWRAVNFGSVA